ncbi:MAG: hypothetical protein Kow00109_03800 [Acidobacteriota bacterium]
MTGSISSETAAPARQSSGRSRLRRTALAVLGSTFLALAVGCSSYSDEPPGEKIDLEAWRAFKPFSLPDLEGRTRTLSEFLDQATIVAFFFPT